MVFRDPQVGKALPEREALQGELDLQESQGNRDSPAHLVT